MYSDASWCAALGPHSLEDLGDGCGSLDPAVTPSRYPFGGRARVAGFMVQEVDVNAIVVVLGDYWRDGGQSLRDFPP